MWSSESKEENWSDPGLSNSGTRVHQWENMTYHQDKSSSYISNIIHLLSMPIALKNIYLIFISKHTGVLRTSGLVIL